MKRFRLLTAEEIECRIKQTTNKGVLLLLYKTARTDADILDETVGAENWENDFKLVDGVLYGGIGINYGSGLVWKWDCGTESNTEAEKGRASDAFKRAGFKHGIGRELYSAPRIWINDPDVKLTNNSKTNQPMTYDTFSVSRITYDDTEHISSLEITNDRSHEVCFTYGTAKPERKQREYKESPPKPLKAKADKAEPKPEVKTAPKAEPVPENKPGSAYCEKCGLQIISYKGKTAQQLIDYSTHTYGKCMCGSCIIKAAKAQADAL